MMSYDDHLKKRQDIAKLCGEAILVFAAAAGVAMIHEGQCGVYKSFTTAMSRNGLYDYMILHDWIKQVFF